MPRLALAALALLLLGVWAPRSVKSHNPITTTVRFDREVVAILNARCAACHVDDGMAMPLQTYEQVRPWAQAIKEEVLARQMPPWPADDGFWPLANPGGLTARERAFLVSWVDGGAPAGDGSPETFVDHRGHWSGGTPDVVIEGRPTTGRPSWPGAVRYVAPVQAASETLLRAIEFTPGHADARAAFFTVAETGEYLGAWTPWHRRYELSASVAMRLPPRRSIAVEVWYGGTAPAAAAAPQIALYRAQRGAPSAMSRTLREGQQRPDGSVRFIHAAERDMQLLAVRPVDGTAIRSLEARVLRVDGGVVPTLRARDYRSEWPTPFVFATAVPLPRGSRLEIIVRGSSAETPVSVDLQLAESSASSPSTRQHAH